VLHRPDRGLVHHLKLIRLVQRRHHLLHVTVTRPVLPALGISRRSRFQPALRQAASSSAAICFGGREAGAQWKRGGRIIRSREKRIVSLSNCKPHR
jgi:hypothetical protein